ncbi:MAG: DHHW family protein [Oscillospiraceae bacterium]|jgi:hypothetical protein
MSARRNTCTALLFLTGLAAAAIFLCLGLLPRPAGFRDAVKPSPAALTAVRKDGVRRSAVPARPDRSAARAIRRGRPLSLPDFSGGVEDLIGGAEPAINDLLDREHTFIQLYGGAQRLLLHRVVEDPDPKYTVVKLTDEVLTFADLNAQPRDMTVRADELSAFARRVEAEFQTPVLYVQAPSKLDMAPLPDGISDYSGAEADQVLAALSRCGVDTLDLRPAFRAAAAERPDALGELFFHTDHHWTPAGAFLGYQILCEKLAADYGFSLADDETLTDPDSFTRTVFDGVFLGSQGKRVGTLYAGTDGIEIWSPTFSTSFTYTVPMSGIEREGPFVTSLLFPERLAQTGYYDTNPYTIYAGDDYLLSRAVNHNAPNAPRVLILRDSFGCALTPFLSLVSGEVMAVDPRNFNGDQEDMMEYLRWLKPDLVIVMNTASSLQVDPLFPYLPTARAAALAVQKQEAQ